MRKKIVWLVVSCLMAASLLLASCGPAAVEEEEEVVTPGEEEVVTPGEEEAVTEEKDMEKVTLEKLDGTVVEKWLEKPSYGGWLNLPHGGFTGFDEAVTMPWSCESLDFTNDELTTGNWAMGPAGTGDATWNVHGTGFLPLRTGSLAESYEIPDNETIIWHIREGVYFHDKPPVNGREMTADDVVFSFQRLFEIPTARLGEMCPEGKRPTSITAPDKYTVVMETPADYQAHIFYYTSALCRVIPPEVVELYGDMTNWENSSGTGPFMIKDYVPMSTMVVERNPNYWMKDPLRPENTLPYVDGIKWLIIPDFSTRAAALRTGKLDHLSVNWEETESLIATNPELSWSRHLPGTGYVLSMRVDKPELPFDDIRVRRALAMAVDHQTIVDDYYGGNAELLTYPVVPGQEFVNVYVPLEELPEVVQESYGYYPDKARQLLAEAGYPDGFETSIVCTAGQADLLSIIKNMWEKIGVNLELQVKEGAVYMGVFFRSTHKEMIYSYSANDAPYTIATVKRDNYVNASKIDDQYCNDAFSEMQKLYLRWDEIEQTFKDLRLHVLENCWYIGMPTAYSHYMWQPWLKDYSGEHSVGAYNAGNWAIYVWLDQDLRQEMTGRR